MAGDTDLAERCALETTRLAQRSIMARHVLAPVELDTGDATYELAPGSTVATLLPLLNTTVRARARGLGPGPLAPATGWPTPGRWPARSW